MKILLHPASRAFALLALLAACTDSTPMESDESRKMIAASQELQSSSMNPADTYVVMDAVQEQSTTVYANTPIEHPTTGQMVSALVVTPPAEQIHVEAGYDPYGRMLVDTYRGAAGDAYAGLVDQSRTLRSVDETFATYDAYGRILPEEVPAGEQPVGPITEYGSLANAQVTSGVVMSYQEYNSVAMMSRSADPASGRRVRLERLPSEGVRITTDFDQGAMAASLAITGEGGREHVSKGREVRTYRREGDQLVIEEIVSTTEREGPAGKVKSQDRVRFSRVRWHKNEKKDKEREERRARRAAGAPSAAMVMNECEIQQMYDTSGPQASFYCSGGGGGGTYTPPPTTTTSCASTSTGRNIAYVHGFNSNGATWSRMDGWLSCDFYLGGKAKPDLSWRQRIDDQTYELQNHLYGTGRSGYLAIGHSQGGIISRNAAQWNGGQVNGVVAISSPHVGAKIATNGRNIVGVVGALIGGLPGEVIALNIADLLLPVHADLLTGGRSGVLNRINATYEPFTRVGIQNHAEKRWVLWRLGADGNCAGPELSCGGRVKVKAVQRSYDKAKKCTIIGFLTIIGSPVGAACGLKVIGMNAVDHGWNLLTAGSDRTDGFIQGQSQVYPYAIRNIVITNADSHSGEVRSPLVRTQLTSTLQAQFYVARR